MEVMINGEKQEMPEGTTALKLLDLLKIDPNRVVIELNMIMLKRDERDKTLLKQGDVVEIVHFVGGGGDRHQTSDIRLKSVVCGLGSDNG